MLSWLFLLLALRSFILAWKEQKPSILRTIDAVLGTFSLILFLLLPAEFHWKLFFPLSLILGYCLYRRLSRPKERKFSFQSLLSWCCLYAIGVFAAVSCTFFRLSEDKKVAKIVLTGNGRSEWVSWKNPTNKHLEGTWLESYEVIVENPQGKEISRQYVYGDLVGLRAEVITIQWPLHLLGFSHLCHLETLYNGYTTASRHNLFPHLGTALPFPLPAIKILWEKLYHGDWRIPGIKSATLESTYLPLMSADLKPHERAYWLVVGSSGLSTTRIE